MVKKYRITYTTEASGGPPKTGHMDSSHLQCCIIHLADTVFIGWTVEVLSDITDNVTEKSYFPPGDGEAVEIDAKWELNKRRHATAGCNTKIETTHTNDLELIGMIAFIKEWLRRGKQWEFKSIDVKSHEELVEIQRKNGGATRTYAKAEDEVDDEDIDRGYEGWVTPGLYKAIERAYDSAYRKEARIQHEESQNVRRVRYYAMIDGHRLPVIGRTNSDRVFANINIINDDIKKKDPRTKCLWEILVCPFKDYEELIEEQRCDGGCIRARKKGKDYGDKIDGIHEVDKKWYREEDPQYSGSESEDDEEDYFEECYEGTWSTRKLLIAQDKAAKKADWFPSHLRLGNVSKKTPASTEKGDFKKESSNRKEEGEQHVLWWMKRQG
ncbi:uncharacterized protein J4E79_000853 [Alternaria viburni]|uniref:uncharacterized protein n=1 Tax=Alternaria viburni TaxID=566460 RepID=UPI0020C4B6CC|nr:uncharacterized protein J4E79_000853 [Alternaria viburni]KAI4670568.1 hypothetical protein J4E79_000853 [Alternaria viburni]